MFGRCSLWILLVICVKLGNSASIRERLSHLIFPGTNWCGIGNIAKTYDDLGSARALDICCREHDMCPDEIDAGKTHYGLQNNYFITRLHCRCDKKFYNCLKNLTSHVSNFIGHIYFNILRYPCFAPLCTGNYVLPWGECPEKNNIENTRKYQWYDIKPYKR